MRLTLRLPAALPSLRRPLLIAAVALLLWVASGMAVPAPLSPYTGRLQGFVTVFMGIFVEALPFLLAGTLVSAAIHLFVSQEAIQRLTPRNPVLAAFAGASLGLAFPVCECGSIPTARRLMTKGSPLSTGIAFALAAPVINPVVLVSTYVAFNSLSMVAWRAGLTLLFAVVVALLVGTAPRDDMVLAPGVRRPEPDEHDHHDHHDHGHHDHGAPGDGALRRTLNLASGEFFEMGRYLVVGGLLAAGLQTLVPQQALLALGTGPVISVLVMIALAVVLSICSTVDAFIALSFVGTFSQGSILAFLVFGPMIDIKSTLMLLAVFRRRTVAAIALLCFQLALLMGVLVNLQLP
jgi:uncharacterized membrane protein YraQ (UPF0718 family)